MTSRIKKATYGTIAAVGLFAGSAAISAAATGNGSDPAPVEAPSDESDADDTGINCENGIDTATGNECDGGPAAADAEEANEAPDSEAEVAEGDEADDGVDHEFEGEEVGENGDGIADADDANENESD